MPEEEISGEEVEGTPEPTEEPADQSLPEVESGAESEGDEFKSQDARKLRKVFFQEQQKLKDDNQALRDQISQLTGMIQASQQTQQPEEDTGQVDLVEKYRPIMQQDYVKGSHQMFDEMLNERERKISERVASEVVERSALQAAGQRVKAQYPEIDQSSPSFNQTAMNLIRQRYQQLAAETGRPVAEGSVLETSLVRAAAAEIFSEQPELRTGKAKQSALEKARIEGRGDSTVPQGSRPRKPVAEELPEVDENIAGLMDITLTDEKRASIQKRIAEKQARFTSKLGKPTS
jgi:hypothetical protein